MEEKLDKEKAGYSEERKRAIAFMTRKNKPGISRKKTISDIASSAPLNPFTAITPGTLTSAFNEAAAKIGKELQKTPYRERCIDDGRQWYR